MEKFIKQQKQIYSCIRWTQISETSSVLFLYVSLTRCNQNQ